MLAKDFRAFLEVADWIEAVFDAGIMMSYIAIYGPYSFNRFATDFTTTPWDNFNHPKFCRFNFAFQTVGSNIKAELLVGMDGPEFI